MFFILLPSETFFFFFSYCINSRAFIPTLQKIFKGILIQKNELMYEPMEQSRLGILVVTIY